MNPGRDLDALVAEKVMGYSDLRVVNDDADGLFKRHIGVLFSFEFTIPNFSTDIAAAWEVAEKINLFEHTSFRLLSLAKNYQGDFGFDDTFEAGMGTATVTIAKAPKLPHAICLAALKAVGHV